jgi:hypothetical protein
VGKEKARLDLDRIWEPVIPDGIISPEHFFGKRELRGDHAFGEGGGEVALIRQAPALGGG